MVSESRILCCTVIMKLISQSGFPASERGGESWSCVLSVLLPSNTVHDVSDATVMLF